jgi:DNA (cytosine-5)-methyltransferase 1
MIAVDLFAGAGGSSTGLASTGITIAAAVNHWPRAVETHTAAHPGARHYCEDAAVLDPTTLPAHDLLWASPSCTGHTPARGKDRPHHDTARATAWCVIRVAEAHRPRLIAVENVPEMQRWALWPAWVCALECLGYAWSAHVLDAADCGVPQERRRLIVTARLGHHAPTLVAPSAPRRSARECIDLDAGSWHPWASYKPASVARIRAAVQTQGPECLVAYYGSVSSHTGRSLDRPIGTLTTRDRYVVVRGDEARVLTVAEQLALSGFPVGYPLTGTRRERVMQVGNAVPPPLAAYVAGQIVGQA